ncbi:hypothetical protein [Parafannyhessea umbonata]|jgi:hypothetical protein|uniref:hypothetical protein n=1 Tax=Parafannyhessea umbonata TaxID=604330 RepID=UPI002A826D42|nr:hypothetical protein [Parafannyhessea umbonata]MDY4418772.1 hypothetical protein [Parafannyhessea umbonata]
MSKRNKKKRPVKGGNASKRRNQESFRLPKVSERKNPDPIAPRDYVITVIELVLFCAIWLIAVRQLFLMKTVLATFLIGVLYFAGAFSMYIVRAALETRRRYGKTDRKTMLYYNQMIKGDQKWSLYIGMSFFAVFLVMRWLIPSPNFNMVGIDIATAFYLGYIWTAKYKGEESLPFEYMETVFLLLTVVSNYIVYFLG